MTGTEILSTFRVVSFDFHRGVAEVHFDHVPLLVLDVDRELFGATGGAEGFI